MLPVSAPSPSNDLIKLINSIDFIYPSLYFPSKYFLIHTTRIIYSSFALVSTKPYSNKKIKNLTDKWPLICFLKYFIFFVAIVAQFFLLGFNSQLVGIVYFSTWKSS
jgi:hypothetical protein